MLLKTDRFLLKNPLSSPPPAVISQPLQEKIIPMEASEVHELQENQEHGGESGLKQVSFTMSLLAVLLAMTTVLGHRTHTEAVLLQARASDQWNFYQAKKNRAYESTLQAAYLDAIKTPGTDALAAKDHAYADKENKDLSEEQDKARDLEAEVRLAEHKASWYDLGEALLQIGVIITSITLLTKRMIYWQLGIFFGVIGMAAAVWAFFFQH
jgi:hypothetical protein